MLVSSTVPFTISRSVGDTPELGVPLVKMLSSLVLFWTAYENGDSSAP